MSKLYQKPTSEPPSLADWKTFVRYCRTTGKLFWRLDRSAKIKAGQEAGARCPLGYVRLKLGKKKHLAHRVVWLLVHGTAPGPLLDHLDGDPSNNRASNLREATKLENSNNIKRGWGLHGLGVDFKNRSYYARIRIGGKLHSLGRYRTSEEACEAYLKAKSRRPGATLVPSNIPALALPERLSKTGYKNIYNNKKGFQVKTSQGCFGTHETMEKAIAIRDSLKHKQGQK